MSKCELEIRLDKNGTFAPGEIVRGRVRVTPRENVECRGLKLWAGWRTHGRGNVREDPDAIVKELFHGNWSAGQPQEYAFEFPAPGSPATYHGTYLNVDHYVTATADIPWSSDPKAEVEILIPGHDGADYDHGPEHGSPQNQTVLTLQTSGMKPSPLATGVMSVMGLTTFVLFLFYGAWGCVGIVGLIAFAALYATMKRKVAERQIGKPLVKLEPNPAKVGGSVAVQVMFEPPASVVLKGGSVRLIGVERVVSGSGTNKTTHRHEVCTVERTLPFADRRVGAGQPISVQETLTIPEHGGPTFMADDNELTWVVHVSIAVQGWPDWEHAYPLTVRPR
jgi:hypothetical protein